MREFFKTAWYLLRWGALWGGIFYCVGVALMAWGYAKHAADYPVPSTADIQAHIIAAERPQMGVTERHFWRDAIRHAADAHAIPADVFTALVAQESRFNSGLVSATGAVGAAQIMPQHAPSAAERAKLREIEPNLDYGARILADALKQCGDIGGALRAYYSGKCAGNRWYSDSVLARVYTAERDLRGIAP